MVRPTYPFSNKIAVAASRIAVSLSALRGRPGLRAEQRDRPPPRDLGWPPPPPSLGNTLQPLA